MSLPAAAALLLSGCADPASQPGAGGVAPSTVTASPTEAVPSLSPPPTRPGPSPKPPGGPTASGRPITLDGIVEAGVEPGCKVLTAAGKSYLIIGDEAVPLGVRVRVTGVLMPGVLTTCQQGTPIRVTDVQPR